MRAMQQLHEVITPLIFGSGFILLGRWMYKNPKRAYPNWMYSNPDSPILLFAGRATATLFLFFGSCMVSAGVGALLLPGESWAHIVIILGGIVGAWYLRPNIPKEAAVGKGSDAAQIPKRQGGLTKKGKWVVGISLVVSTLLFFGSFAAIGNSEVCQLAVQRTQSNSLAIERLGTPIKKGLMIGGKIETTGPSGHADIAIPVSGPKSKGTLYVVGIKSAGIWKFETLQLAVEGSPERVDLLDSSASKPIQH